MVNTWYMGCARSKECVAAGPVLIPKGIKEDALHRSLIQVLASVLLLIGLFVLPGFAVLFEGAEGDWQQNEVGRIRRNAWPLLKDPDSLLTMQSLLRCVLLAIALHCTRHNIGTQRSSARGRVLSSIGVMLFFAAYATRVLLFQFCLFRMEGPIGGCMTLTVDILVTFLVLLAAVRALLGCRPVEVMIVFMSTALVFSMTGWIASHNYLVIDPQAGIGGNAAFIFMNLIETAGCMIILAGLIAGPGWNPGRVFRLLATFQQALAFYYILDSLEKAPQSTLSFGIPDPEGQILALPMQGKPEELLVFAQGVQFGSAAIACLLPVVEPVLLGRKGASMFASDKEWCA